MPVFSKSATEILASMGSGDYLGHIERFYEELRGDRIPELHYGDPDLISQRRRARNNITVLHQGLINRAVRLCAASGALSEQSNVIGQALVIRGHIEATAQLGYFCDRLSALARGNIDFNSFNLQLANTLMGASHSTFEGAPKPLHIMTCIEKADRYLDQNHGELPAKQMIADLYGWLSDFCHPNFLSSQSSHSLNKETHSVIFTPEGAVGQHDADMLVNLSVSCTLFQLLHRDFPDLLPILDDD